MVKIAILVLATSNKRDQWRNIKDTYLFHSTIKTFLYTMDKEHEYIFYIGIDKNDRIFDKKEEQSQILNLSNNFSNVTFKFITCDNIPKGYVTLMWNKLFYISYKENCMYFYQCGDDIKFLTKGWINDSIKVLKSNYDIGITGPINNHGSILTQAFVSRKHMEIFGFFFPKEIKNWYCDDWYNQVYRPNFLYPLYNHYAFNLGGNPRYKIEDTILIKKNLKKIVYIYQKILYNYINRYKMHLVNNK